MGTNCAPLVTDLFLLCYERDFICCLFQVITNLKFLKLLNSTFRYLYKLLNMDNNFFDSMINHIYPSELQLNKANVSGTEA